MPSSPGVTHQFGAWSPLRFIPVPTFGLDGPAPAPAFWLVVTRVCRRRHDILCSEAQTLTFGPLAVQEDAQEPWQCPNCRRHQPAQEGHAEDPVCLFCSDAAFVQYTAPASATESVSAVAALAGAATTLHQLKDDPAASTAALTDTADTIRILFEITAHTIRQDHHRAQHAGTRITVQAARTVLANTRTYVEELLPVRENDDE